MPKVGADGSNPVLPLFLLEGRDDMNSIEERLIRGFDELNRLEYLKLTRKTVESKFAEVLEEAYIAGFASAAYILGETPRVNIADIGNAMTKVYDGESIFTKAKNYVGNEGELKRLFESEYHRCFTQGELDMAKAVAMSAENAASGTGGEIVKRWNTMQDDKVRDTHSYLQGISVPLDAEYTTFDGDKAKAPGDFRLASNNANCRCYLTFERI